MAPVAKKRHQATRKGTTKLSGKVHPQQLQMATEHAPRIRELRIGNGGNKQKEVKVKNVS